MAVIMNEFKGEFRQLLLRHASLESAPSNRGPEMPAPLSNQQILDAIHEVLRATLNINLQNIDAAAFKTPANEILIGTPATPDVLRLDYDQNTVVPARCKRIDTSTNELIKLSNSPLLSNGGTNMEVLDNENARELADINDKEIKNEVNLLDMSISQFQKDSLKKELPKNDFNNITIQSIEDAYQDAVKVVDKLKNLKEQLQPECRPIRRLSAMMGLPHVKQQQQQSSCSNVNNLRTTRAKALRRSAINEDIPVTPTSSVPGRLSLGAGLSSLQPKKPITSTSTSNGMATRTSVTTSKVSTIGQNQRSTSSLSVQNESSKSAGSKSPTKSVKNVKYAHVQSTIRKPLTNSAVKRKA